MEQNAFRVDKISVSNKSTKVRSQIILPPPPPPPPMYGMFTDGEMAL